MYNRLCNSKFINWEYSYKNILTKLFRLAPINTIWIIYNSSAHSYICSKTQYCTSFWVVKCTYIHCVNKIKQILRWSRTSIFSLECENIVQNWNIRYFDNYKINNHFDISKPIMTATCLTLERGDNKMPLAI